MSKVSPLWRLATQVSVVEVMYAVREYDVDGNYYVDVVNPDTGTLGPMQCFVVGGDGKNLGIPKAPWMPGRDLNDYPQVVVLHRGDNRQPLVLDVLTNLSGRYTTSSDTSSTSNNNTQSPATYQRRDRIIHNGDSSFIIRDDGTMVIDLAKDQTLYINLNGGVLRLGHGDTNGDTNDADDRAVLAKPAVEKLNTIILGYNALLAAIQTATAAAITSPAPGDAFVATLLGALSGVPTLSSAELGELQSAVLYLSSLAGN